MPRWTPEARQQQALRCLQNQPWKHSTGPKQKRSSLTLTSLTEQALAQLQVMAGLGLEPKEIARILRISQSGFKELLQQPEVLALYQQARAIAELSPSLALFRLAVGGNLRAIIWWEKTRLRRQHQSKPCQHGSVFIYSPKEAS
jgi:hypothetical protein